MKNMIHLKKALVSKEAFSRENSEKGGIENFYQASSKNFLGGRGQNSCVDMFLRDADCPKKMSARGRGSQNGPFLRQLISERFLKEYPCSHLQVI